MITQHEMRWLQTYRLPFTWSHSRDQLYSLCQRQYYLRYYAPYGGNSPDEEGDRVLFYLLGRLTSTSALIGNTVHHVARDALQSARAGRSWEAGVYTATADLLLRRSINRSQKGCAHPAGQVQRQTVLLQEHYYHQPLDEMRAYADVRDYTEGLRDHPAFQSALANAQHLMLVDEVRRFDVGGVLIFCVPDVLLGLPDRSYWLIDWKTGSAVAENLEISRRQLAIYALYLQQVEGAHPEAIHCEVADLRHIAEYQWQLTAGDLEEARERVLDSITEMKQHLRDINANQAMRDDYPQTSIGGAGEGPCAWCAFRRACFG
ncbi:MAG: PD-(D/E)XK nuclease family protein [Anaerolineae bacterium]